MASVKGGALYQVLVVLVLLTGILLLMLWLFQADRELTYRLQKQEDLMLLCEEGVRRAMKATEEGGESFLLKDSLAGKLVDIRTTNWGVFRMVRVRASAGAAGFELAYLIGEEVQETGLWVADHYRPLRICGTADLDHRPRLPNKGLSVAYLEGKAYTGKPEMLKNFEPSGGHLPFCARGMDFLENGWGGYEDSLVSMAELSNGWKQDFHSPRMVVQAQGSIELNEVTLEGNILVRSDERIEVGPEADLQHVVLEAPEVVVEDYQGGPFQILASAKVEVKGKSRMKYPSAIVLIPAVPEAEGVFLSEEAEVHGIVFAVAKRGGATPQVFLLDNSRVVGQVYVNGRLDLRSEVLGDCYADRLVMESGSGVHENTWLDGKVYVKKRPRGYVGLGMGEGPSVARIISRL